MASPKLGLSPDSSKEKLIKEHITVDDIESSEGVTVLGPVHKEKGSAFSPKPQASRSEAKLTSDSIEEIFDIIDGDRYHAIFDDEVINAIGLQLALDPEYLSDYSMRRSRQATLAAIVIGQAVDLTELKLKQLGLVKSELVDEMLEFRELLASYEGNSQGPEGLWSSLDAQEVYVDQVQVDVMRLHRRLARNTYRQKLGEEYLGKPLPWIEAVAAATASYIGGLPLVGGIVAIGTLSAGHFMKAGWDTRQERDDIKKDPLIYLELISDEVVRRRD